MHAVKLAEGEGFEPSKVSLAGFQDRCTRPLCEPSVGKLTVMGRRAQNRELLPGFIRADARALRSPGQRHRLGGVGL